METIGGYGFHTEEQFAARRRAADCATAAFNSHRRDSNPQAFAFVQSTEPLLLPIIPPRKLGKSYGTPLR
jgi:hypothetical protein